MFIEDIGDKIKFLCWMIAVGYISFELGWFCGHMRIGNLNDYNSAIVVVGKAIKVIPHGK